MKVSTKARYGLRFLVELAAGGAKGPVFLKDIARTQEISEKYLSRIVIDLKAAGLVDGYRGAHGGYVLAKKPEDITLREVVTTLEGDLSPVDCVKEGGTCGRMSMCATQDAWRKLKDAINSTLESITLASLVEKRNEKCQGMYYI
ncbi:MAG: hypothetical protein A2Y07_03935 [Planctomycetes bacterium GWF2_50_10]|nr:MAG: hypothetical protein A2Y07_03935 [Planctomycetes bacterium GWF2_50_10]